jgi:hypothetical protein
MTTRPMDFDDPAARADLLETAGVEAYEAARLAHIEATTVAHVEGHRIRRQNVRINGGPGFLFVIDAAQVGYLTLGEAEDYARRHPLESPEAPTPATLAPSQPGAGGEEVDQLIKASIQVGDCVMLSAKGMQQFPKHPYRRRGIVSGLTRHGLILVWWSGNKQPTAFASSLIEVWHAP